MKFSKKEQRAIKKSIVEMTEDDKQALKEALKEHREVKTVPFKPKARKD